MNDTTNNELLRILEAHEITIAALYQAFSVRLPTMVQLWDQLANEEKEHASWLRILREHMDTEGTLLNRRSFNSVAVQTSIDYIKRRIAEMSGAEVKPLQALAIGLDLETSMIEKEFFRVLPSDSAEMQKQFMMLSEQTANHRKMIEAFIAAERGKAAL